MAIFREVVLLYKEAQFGAHELREGFSCKLGILIDNEILIIREVFLLYKEAQFTLISLHYVQSLYAFHL